MHISLIIPAKGSSERIKNKNLFRLNGKTLVRRTCEKVLDCKNINAIYLDTESEAIIQDTEDLVSSGLNFIKRPKELSNNDIGANEMMIYGLHSIDETDILCQTFSTSPLITSKTIDKCIEKFISSPSHDSFFTVINSQEYIWDENYKPINFDTNALPNSFELPNMYIETHRLYGIRKDSLLKTKRRVGENPLLIEINKNESLDVNDNDDLELLKKIYDENK